MWTTTDAPRSVRAYRRAMTDECHLELRPGPILLCAGTEPSAAASLAAWQSVTYALSLARLAVPAPVAHKGADERDDEHERSRIAAALLGSTAKGILRHAARPVLLVPPPATV
jgi:hypothetical protein